MTLGCDCVVCFCEIVEETVSPAGACQSHPVCGPCLTRYAEIQIQDGKVRPKTEFKKARSLKRSDFTLCLQVADMKCPGESCGTTLPLSLLEHLLDDEHRAKLKKFLAFKENPKTRWKLVYRHSSFVQSDLCYNFNGKKKGPKQHNNLLFCPKGKNSLGQRPQP